MSFCNQKFTLSAFHAFFVTDFLFEAHEADWAVAFTALETWQLYDVLAFLTSALMDDIQLNLFVFINDVLSFYHDIFFRKVELLFKTWNRLIGHFIVKFMNF